MNDNRNITQARMSVEDEEFVGMKINMLRELLEDMRPNLRPKDYLFFRIIINDMEFKNWAQFNSYYSFVYDKICDAHINKHYAII